MIIAFDVCRDEFTKFLQNKAAGVVEESEMKEVIAKINARLRGGGNQG